MLAYLPYVRTRIAALIGDRKGVTSLEYTVIAAVTVLVTGVGVTLISPQLTALWIAINADLAVPG